MALYKFRIIIIIIIIIYFSVCNSLIFRRIACCCHSCLYMGDNNVILYTLATVAMLEVYHVPAVQRRKLAYTAYACKLLFVLNYVSETLLAENFFSRFSHFSPVFVHIRYTPNMTACYNNDVHLMHTPSPHQSFTAS